MVHRCKVNPLVLSVFGWLANDRGHARPYFLTGFSETVDQGGPAG